MLTRIRVPGAAGASNSEAQLGSPARDDSPMTQAGSLSGIPSAPATAMAAAAAPRSDFLSDGDTVTSRSLRLIQ
jgi:hypothetical protein